jgi:ribonuclease-3
MFDDIEKNIGYTFRDKGLLQKALTLSSFDNDFNNQSLECMGDSLLSFIVAEKYYLLGYDEGSITQMKKSLSSDKALAPVSIKLGLDKALIRGKGDVNNKKAIPSAYEAFVAAVYLDGGMESAKKFVLSSLDFSRIEKDVDYISALQELLQSSGHLPPEYKKTPCGTPQSPLFKVEIEVFGKTYSATDGNSRTAKKLAAKAAYLDINK